MLLFHRSPQGEGLMPFNTLCSDGLPCILKEPALSYICTIMAYIFKIFVLSILSGRIIHVLLYKGHGIL